MKFITVLTERGQVSVPAEIRRALGLKPGRKLIWEKVSQNECRIRTQSVAEIQPDPVRAIGFGRRAFPDLPFASTQDYLRTIREGED